MNLTLDELRRDIESTRYVLGDKIATLERRIQTTKNTTLNPEYYLKTSPWPILAVITLMGYFVGRGLKSKPSKANLSRVNKGDTGVIGGMVRSMMIAISGSAGRMVVDSVRNQLNKRQGGDRV